MNEIRSTIFTQKFFCTHTLENIVYEEHRVWEICRMNYVRANQRMRGRRIDNAFELYRYIKFNYTIILSYFFPIVQRIAQFSPLLILNRKYLNVNNRTYPTASWPETGWWICWGNHRCSRSGRVGRKTCVAGDRKDCHTTALSHMLRIHHRFHTPDQVGFQHRVAENCREIITFSLAPIARTWFRPPTCSAISHTTLCDISLYFFFF